MSPDPIGTRPAEAMLLRELAHLRDEVQAHRVDVRERLDDIAEQVTATNGRLRRAEAWVAGMKAIAAAIALLIPFAVALFTHNL